MGGSSQETRSRKHSAATNMDEDSIEKLVSKVCSNFVQQLEKKLDTGIRKLENRLTEACDTFSKVSAEVASNKKSICKMQNRLENLDQVYKRNSLRICGLPESNSENLGDTLMQFFHMQLKTSCEVSEFDSYFRVGSLEEERPRTVIVRFLRQDTRNRILALKDSPYSIFEDLTSERYTALLEAKKKFGNNNAWSSGGRVFYWDTQKGKKVLFTGESSIA